ncbi:hypothetical protein [Lysinibacillus fusiformis]|nr:hypothetical protein [Lysinibacillus fusiformis]MCR8854843.1 hypothetical protein [Lysinibacillus fusiformis]
MDYSKSVATREMLKHCESRFTFDEASLNPVDSNRKVRAEPPGQKDGIA